MHSNYNHYPGKNWQQEKLTSYCSCIVGFEVDCSTPLNVAIDAFAANRTTRYRFFMHFLRMLQPNSPPREQEDSSRTKISEQIPGR